MRNYIVIFMLLIICQSGKADDPYGLTERIPNTSFLLSTSGDTLAAMQMTRAFSNLNFSRPIYLIHAGDGSDRIFVVEKGGIIKTFANDPVVSQAKTFLDISAQVNSSPSEAGLLSMAFHPDYQNNGLFYVYYNFGSLFSRVSEFKVSADPDSANPASERSLFEIQQPYTNHNGGQIAFGADNYLYIGLGDGGSGGDPLNSGQDTQTLLGSILRINIDSSAAEKQYAIPTDNPFYGLPESGLPEIWAWGLRNPWRFSFDRLTGALWAGDVGQGDWEEVDLIEGGKNYGWRIMEGFHCYNPSTGCDTTGLTLPIVEYSHTEGKSITGGFVYRGKKQPRLNGVYLYGDYVTRKIWGLKYENGQILDNRLIAENPSSISSFGEDEAGEVYVVGYDGKIYIFEEKPGNPAPRHIPATISESGLFTSIDSLIPAPGIIPYSVNSQLWSDGAHKTRYIALPDTSKIQFNLNTPWQFPPNAVLVKNFFLDLVRDDPGSRKIIETRFLVRHANDDQWEGFSYWWNEEQTDATLLESAQTRTFNIIDGPDTVKQTYYYPSREECIVCHTPETGYVIGVRTSQINKDHKYGEVTDNQLRSYNHIRLFTDDIGEDYSTFPRMADPADSTEGIERRARSYLDANCANCHLPGGSGRSNLDLRYDIPLELAYLVNEPAMLDNMGIIDALRLKPGAADSSIIYLRMTDTTKYRMPPLATSVVDTAGAALLKAWIDSLGIASGIADRAEIPDQIRLFPAYPNPFNPTTTISFELPVRTKLKLTVYNLRGQKVVDLVDAWHPAGRYSVQWNAENSASGIYILQMRTSSGFERSHKLVLVK